MSNPWCVVVVKPWCVDSMVLAWEYISGILVVYWFGGIYRWYIDYWWYIGGIGLDMMLSFEM